MVDVGSQANFVDTQKVSLVNTSDSKTYVQITDASWEIDSTVTKHHLTDDQVDNVFDLYANFIQGNMWVTTPEYPDLIALTVDVAGVRPTKVWQIVITDQSGLSNTITINGQMKTLKLIDTGIGAVKLFFHIEADQALGVS